MADQKTQQLTTATAARIALLSEGTIRAAANRGELRHTRTESGVRLFERHVIEEFARQRHQPKQGPTAASA